MDSDNLKFKEELLRLVWYMRGGVSYTEVFCMSQQERDLIGKIVKDNLETTKKSRMPFF